ncbi:MAG: PilN domain-containing protein, partial [Alphaproteobacteria bacterium]|nr:PilN domain-containing protein [Alphaproteobacteria bacterium]
MVVVIDGSTARLAYEAHARDEVIGPLDLAGTDPAQVARLLSPNARRRAGPYAARLRLDPAVALQVPMTLPLAALANLGQVVEFEFDRFSPFSRDRVYFRHRIASRDVENAQLHLELTIVPRDLIDDLRRQARQNGLHIVGIDVADAPLPLGGNARAEASQRAHLLKLTSRALSVLAVAMAVAVVVIPYVRDDTEIAQLTADIAAAKTGAGASLKLQDAIDSEIHDQSFVIDRKKATPPVTELIASLTRILPDDTWLTELQINGDTVLLGGYAASATAVLTMIDRSPLLTEASFRSSVTQDAQLGR